MSLLQRKNPSLITQSKVTPTSSTYKLWITLPWVVSFVAHITFLKLFYFIFVYVSPVRMEKSWRKEYYLSLSVLFPHHLTQSLVHIDVLEFFAEWTMDEWIKSAQRKSPLFVLDVMLYQSWHCSLDCCVESHVVSSGPVSRFPMAPHSQASLHYWHYQL